MDKTMKNMLEILKYIFSDFFIWLGFVIILIVFFTGVSDIINALKR